MTHSTVFRRVGCEVMSLNCRPIKTLSQSIPSPQYAFNEIHNNIVIQESMHFTSDLFSKLKIRLSVIITLNLIIKVLNVKTYLIKVVKYDLHSEYIPSVCSVVCVYSLNIGSSYCSRLFPSDRNSPTTSIHQIPAPERTIDDMRQMCERLYCMTVIVSNNSLYIISNV